ncbi:hypothetical protein [Natrinema amylolyticum]|uniref:hypothetical protein n=1 Tax=Natrinema amylolyticum TaxID=2878679 RepID=UPI001CFA8677|nr:hypothetical protein [Natrinema amylolyticum]
MFEETVSLGFLVDDEDYTVRLSEDTLVSVAFTEVASGMRVTVTDPLDYEIWDHRLIESEWNDIFRTYGGGLYRFSFTNLIGSPSANLTVAECADPIGDCEPVLDQEISLGRVQNTEEDYTVELAEGAIVAVKVVDSDGAMVLTVTDPDEYDIWNRRILDSPLEERGMNEGLFLASNGGRYRFSFGNPGVGAPSYRVRIRECDFLSRSEAPNLTPAFSAVPEIG